MQLNKQEVYGVYEVYDMGGTVCGMRQEGYSYGNICNDFQIS